MFKFEKAKKAHDEKMQVLVPAESVITGKIETRSDIGIYGHVGGDVSTSGNVYIGEGAKVNGNIVGFDIHIHGDVAGNISADGEFVMYADASLSGDIKAAGIRMEKGIKYDGHISISMEARINPV